MSSAPRVKKVMTQAINLIFEFLQKVVYESPCKRLQAASTYLNDLFIYAEGASVDLAI